MVFTIIFCSVFIIMLVLGLIFDENISFIFGLVGALFLAFTLVLCAADSVSNQREWEDMRDNPSMYSIYEIHEANEKMKEHMRYKGSIFSFYNGYEFEYLEEKI